jgi:hypothetical protein
VAHLLHNDGSPPRCSTPREASRGAPGGVCDLEASMARLHCISVWLIVAAATAAGCAATPDGGPTDDPECQIEAEGERTPGYPFDLEAFAQDVLPVVAASCGTVGCHAAPTGQGGFSIWAEAEPGNCDYAKTFNSIKDQIDLDTPENSPLIIAISGGLPIHPIQYQAGDPNLTTLSSYVEDASARYAADGGGNTPPPGASPFDYGVYQTVIQPIVDTAEDRGCTTSGCHGTGAGGFTITAAPAANSAEMEANFIAVTSRTNLTAPESSLFYVQATNRHGSGGSAVVAPAEGAEILAWILDAKENAGGATNPDCAPVDRFNGAVFRDEILPILRGDVDLNGGDGNVTGCTRGPCHGTDRGPGVLYIADQMDPATALQNFACFVDLVSPSASEVLLCPLDDPRCRRSPHPGQDVFTGADDLNYQKILAYLYGSTADATPLDFAFFVRRINPIFNDIQAVEDGAQGRTCADAVGCHGVSVAGQAPPNGSNFPIIPNAADKGRLTYNFASAASFANFLAPEESSLFLYPTNEIANVEDHPLATGLPHPGGTDFATDDIEALNILRWSGGLRPNGQGFVTDWLVAGDYAASRVTDLTPIDEINAVPQIFDPTGAPQFNAGQWDGLFNDDANNEVVDLNRAFPRDATSGRIAYAVAYVVNTSNLDITAQMEVTSDNALRIYVDDALVAQADDASGGVATIAQLPAFGNSKKSTRLLFKLFQSADDEEFSFTVQFRDDLGNLLTDASQELVILLGPQGGI